MRSHGQAVLARARPIAFDWRIRAAIAAAVFVAFVAIGRVTARSGGSEVVPAATVSQAASSAVAVPAALTGPPPLERVLGERAAAESAELERNAARARAAARHAVPIKSEPSEKIEGAATVTSTETQTSAPAATTLSEHSASSRTPATQPKKSFGASGKSFDSSG
jgi:hypothetical protein